MFLDELKWFFYLIVIVFAIFIVLAFLSFSQDASPDEVAIDLALATMIESVSPGPAPSPYACPSCKDTGWIVHGGGNRTKCSNCDLASLPGGPLDIFKQAKELIRKGNELADRGKKLLDAIQKDGKLSVDILLPFEAGESPSVTPRLDGISAAPEEVCPVGNT